MSKIVIIQIVALILCAFFIFLQMVFIGVMGIPAGDRPTSIGLNQDWATMISVGAVILIALLSLLVFFSFLWEQKAGASFPKIIIAIRIATIVISFSPMAYYLAAKTIHNYMQNRSSNNEYKAFILEMKEHLKLGKRYTAEEAVIINFHLFSICKKEGFYSKLENIDEALMLISELMKLKLLDPTELVSDGGAYKGTSLCNYFYKNYSHLSKEGALKVDQSILKRVLFLFQPYCGLD